MCESSVYDKSLNNANKEFKFIKSKRKNFAFNLTFESVNVKYIQ